MEKLVLKNNMRLICKKAPNTPRVAVTCFIDIDRKENTPGVYSLLNRLFLQGTKTRTAEQLAETIEQNALDLYSEMKSDYWKFSLLCLKEDLELGFELMSDMMMNSTLENFEKELTKMKGETIASLDSPSMLARDNFVENLYPDHQYGHTGTVILQNIDKITKSEVQKAYSEIFLPAEKVFAVVGDIEKEEAKALTEKYFSCLQSAKNHSSMESPIVKDTKIVKIAKNDAQQAQIYQGWIVPDGKHEDSPALSVLNTILGSSGLSSRLFLELRDKKGLAYTVRSMYSKARHSGDFRVYIATEPKNINVSLAGFKHEIDKLKCEPVSEKELEDAKNNIIGKIQFITETNQQQSSSVAFYEFEGLGYDYLPVWVEKLKAVKIEDVQRVTQKYFDEKYVLMVLAPQKYLDEV